MVRAIPLGNRQIINHCEVIQIFRELCYISAGRFFNVKVNSHNYICKIFEKFFVFCKR